MSPARLFAALVVLSLTAGCAGLFGGVEERPGPSPPATTEASATPEPISYPPGVTDRGVVDPLRLANAHRAATSAFSHGYERSVAVDYANGTRTEWSKTAWYDADRRAYYQEQRIEGDTEVLDAQGRFDLWSNETTSVVREPPDEDGSFYRAGDGVFGRGFLGSRLVSLFAGVDTVTTGTTTDGRPLVHLLGTGGANSQTSLSSVENARDVSLSAAVTPEGVVRSYTLRYEGEADGETVAVTETFRLRRMENVPDRPAWVTEGLAATDDRS